MKLSILTATYNRAKFLEGLYKSILKNIETSNMEAEWIIINDGSTDNTEKIIENLIFENRIKIKYVFQENSGKMTAINRGMEEVTGELIVDCDSDDFFTDNAFEIIEQNASKLLKNEKMQNYRKMLEEQIEEKKKLMLKDDLNNPFNLDNMF